MSARLKYRSLLYGIPVLLAVFARAIVFWNWLESPLRLYHKIPGLDMETFIYWGKLFCMGREFFSIYRVMLGITYLLNGQQPWAAGMVFLQLLLGVASVFLITWITAHLTGKRRYAIITGCLAALYAPELLYETVILRESTFVFVTLLAFAVLLRARKRHFSTGWLIVCGAVTFLPLLMRFSGLLWAILSILWIFWYCYKRKRNISGKKPSTLKKVLPLFAGCVIVLAPPTIYHTIRFKYPFPTRMNLDYVFKTGGSGHQSINPEQPKNIKKLQENTVSPSCACPYANLLVRTGNAAKNTLVLLSPYEMPNNINYYFLKYRLSPLHLLIGPLLLIPLAITGLILMLFRNPFKNRYGLMLLYLAAYGIPVILYLPLSRLRLTLFPAFCFFVPCTFLFIKEKLEHHEPDRLAKIAFAVVLYAVILFVSIKGLNYQMRSGLRATDFVTYGRTLEMQNGDPQEVFACYREAYKLNQEHRLAAILLAEKLIGMGKFTNVEAVLYPVYRKDPKDYKVALCMSAARLGGGDPKTARMILRKISVPKTSPALFNYYYCLGESNRQLKNNTKAAEFFRKAVDCAPNQQIRENLKKLISQME